jgi:hypothetical protein
MRCYQSLHEDFFLYYQIVLFILPFFPLAMTYLFPIIHSFFKHRPFIQVEKEKHAKMKMTTFFSSSSFLFNTKKNGYKESNICKRVGAPNNKAQIEEATQR